ncbi:MAG TPA: hypothetical protein VFQ44_22495 [Streptosporangiaceae bacterium]|nr:hypothetical protein [Streptosporangiaceae bacterium]
MFHLSKYRRSAFTLAVVLPLAGALASQGVASGQPVTAAHARTASGSATKWTKISTNTNLSIASAGLSRTADGRLHVVWASRDGLTFSMHYSTVGGRAKLLNTGTIVKHWAGISSYPMLVSGPGKGLRLIFTGGNGVSNSPFDTGAMYTATATPAGTSWKLVTGSLSQSKLVPLTNTTAATRSDGTPVAAWSTFSALGYHVGVDPNIPASAPDQSFGVGAGDELVTPTVIRAKNGAILGAWFNGSGQADQGYYVAQILPAKAAAVKAPSSGGKNVGNNQNLQPVAFTARAGGREYLAYCVPTKFLNCAHIDLWRVGAAKAMTVPGSSSANGSGLFVAIAASPGGHLWVLWVNTRTNKIEVVRTNAAVTSFGSVRTLSSPAHLAEFQGLQAQGSAGPLDVIALALQNGSTSGPGYFDTQLLPALRIRASKSSVPNGRTTTITFTVQDTGDRVSGATVKFLGVTKKTGSKGMVTFTIKKGTAKGKHLVTATKNGFSAASLTIKVT